MIMIKLVKQSVHLIIREIKLQTVLVMLVDISLKLVPRLVLNILHIQKVVSTDTIFIKKPAQMSHFVLNVTLKMLNVVHQTKLNLVMKDSL